MTASPPVRSLSGSGATWSALRRGPGITTVGGQDKRAHIAPSSVGCFCWIFLLLPHRTAFGDKVRRRPKLLYLKDLLHIAGLRHVR